MDNHRIYHRGSLMSRAAIFMKGVQDNVELGFTTCSVNYIYERQTPEGCDGMLAILPIRFCGDAIAGKI